MGKKILYIIISLLQLRIISYSAVPKMAAEGKSVVLTVFSCAGSTRSVSTQSLYYSLAEPGCISTFYDTNKKVQLGFFCYQPSGDYTPPASITDLKAFTSPFTGCIDLQWLSTGDDGLDGNIIGGMFAIQYSSWTNFQDIVWSTQNAQVFISTGSVVDPVVPLTYRYYTIQNLLPGVTYYFRVWTRDDADNWSDISVGATVYAGIQDLTPPAKVTTLVASVGSVPGEIVLSWLSVGDDGFSGTLLQGSRVHIASTTVLSQAVDQNYWVQKGTTNAEIKISTSGVSPYTLVKYNVLNLQQGVTYYFRLWVQDEAGNWSEISNTATSYAKVDTEPPPVPQLLSPQNGSSTTELTPSFDWTDVLDPSGVTYSFQLDVQNTFATPIVSVTGLTSSNYTVTQQLSVNTTYYWRVEAVDGRGNRSGWSEIWSIFISPPAPPPTEVYYGNLFGLKTSVPYYPSLNTATKKFAIRFTPQRSATVSKIHIYATAAGSPPSYTIGLQTDNNGFPSGNYISASTVTTTTSWWVEVDIPDVPVIQGTTYYIVVSSGTAEPTSSNYIYVRSGLPLNKFLPLSPLIIDTAASVLDYDISQPSSWVLKDFQPIYTLEYTDGKVEGNPYVGFADYTQTGISWWEVCGSTVVGQEFVVEDSTRYVSHIGVYVIKKGSPKDNLYYGIYDITDGSSVMIDSGVVATAGEIITTDYQWVEKPLSNVFTLTKDRKYRITFYSPNSTSQLNSYLICVPNTVSANTKYTQLSWGGTNGYAVKSLNNGSTFSSYSTRDLTFRFKIATQVQDTQPPAVPTLVSPIGLSSTTLVTFVWQEVSDPSGVKYNLQLAQDSSFTTPILNLTDLSQARYTVTSPLAENTTYYWRVQAVDGVGNQSAWSQPASFVIDTTPPQKPVLISPQYGAQVSTVRPSFDWSDVTDPSGVTYSFQLDVQNTFTTPIVSVTGLTSSNYTVTQQLSVNTTYYWRVKAVDGAGNESIWSDIWQFVVIYSTSVEDYTTPAKVTTLTAEPGSLIGSVKLTWISVGDDDFVVSCVGEIRIQYNTQATGFDKNNAQVIISTTITPYEQRSIEVPQLNVGVTYYFALWIKDDSGNWSEISNIASSIAFDIEDKVPPTVTHKPYSYIGMLGNKVVIIADVYDEYGVKEVVLKYRKKGEGSSYTGEVKFIPYPDATLQNYRCKAEIPVSSVTLSGIEYYIIAYDFKNNKGYYKSAGNPQSLDVSQQNYFVGPFETNELVIPDGNPEDGSTMLILQTPQDVEHDIEINRLENNMYKATQDDTEVDINKNNGYPLAVYEIRPYAKTLPQKTKFKVLYLDTDGDSVIDNTSVSETEDIRMYFWKGSKWELCSNVQKNTEDNTVTADIYTTGIYALFIYSQQSVLFEIKNLQKFITPDYPLVLHESVVECEIYDLSGKKVDVVKKEAQTSKIIWYGKVKDKYVESGCYILRVKDDQGKVYTTMVIFAK
jgi:hypothetical protein